MKTHWDAIIVGGGAAGLWAAGTAAERGKRVGVGEKQQSWGEDPDVRRDSLQHHPSL